MAEMMKKATRQSYGEALVELAKTNPKVVVMDADLAHATQTMMFKEVCPERFFNAGIAENNMIGVAAGLSTCGYIPFASTFAMFAAGRSYDQIRNMLGYPHNNVKICATHAGISVGEDGATHQCNEDIALMRVVPGMVVMNPADDTEAKACIKAAVDYQGPVYIRLGRMACPIFNDPETYKFEMGKGVQTDSVKNTFVRLYGIEKCEALVQKYTDMALEALDVFENNEYMTELARSLTQRRV
jgi:transketolase